MKKTALIIALAAICVASFTGCGEKIMPTAHIWHAVRST